MRCPDGAVLAAWVDDEVEGPLSAAVAHHLDDCPRCRRLERAQQQVKRRTSLLSAAAPAPGPGRDLMTMLMTVPQAEHDRALRQAHRASCGEQRSEGGTRLRVAVVGAGAAVWLAAAVMTAPVGTPAGPSGPGSAGQVTPTTVPAGAVPVAPVNRLLDRSRTGGDEASAR